ncbi:MAG: DUF839 domain-containing protein [Gaiellales bacterium]
MSKGKWGTTGLALAGAAAVAATAIAASGAPTGRGPSTTTDPYVLPVAPGVEVKSLVTVGDGAGATNGYRLVGIPDGLGARKDGDGFVVYMNHELRATQGAVRAHGQAGAFVSRWRFDAKTLEAQEGADLISSPTSVTFWDYVTATPSATPSAGGPNPRVAGDTFPAQLAAFSRFCSASFTDRGQLFNPKSKRGYDGRIYFANEENGVEGRVFGVTEDGAAQQLPRLGLFSWENTLAAQTRGDVTLVLGQEDSADGQLWVYVGMKQKTGNAFDRAGLTNGVDYVVDLTDETVSTDAGYRTTFGKAGSAAFDLATVPWDLSGAAQNAIAKADGLTLNRIEDGAWDPRNRNDFYFVTTEGGVGATATRDGGGLWRLRFKDVERPWLGGSLTLLLDGSEPPLLNKPDNLDIDRHGNVLIQEDPGNNAHLARIVAYDIATGRTGVVAMFDPALFAPATPGGTDAVLTADEESSGIIDVGGILGDGWFLLDAQAHRAHPDTALVEYGQLLAMKVPSFKKVYGG